jgi:hypothetical protein
MKDNHIQLLRLPATNIDLEPWVEITDLRYTKPLGFSNLIGRQYNLAVFIGSIDPPGGAFRRIFHPTPVMYTTDHPMIITYE